MHKAKKLFISVVAVVGALVPVAAPAYAATDPSAVNGYRVSPVRSDLNLKPGQTSQTTVYIQNASNAVEKVQVIVNDFQPPSNESGNPALLLNGATAPRHSLKKFVKIPNPNLTLQPGEQQPVTVVVTVPAGAAPGGYYGAVRVAPQGASTGKNVNLSGSVASLVLLTVQGKITEQLSIAGFGVTKGDSGLNGHIFTSGKDLQAFARFQNSGNVQVAPFGKVLLKKGTKTLGTYSINDKTPAGNVLPDSIRRFNTKLDKVGSFGKYKVIGNFGFGAKGELLTAQTTIYVVPVAVIVIVLLALVFLAFLVFGLPKLVKRHDRRVLSRNNR